MILYDLGEGQLKNWIVAENNFDSRFVGKCEAIMCLGNGYMGIRSATEERYLREKRNAFVAGTFNRFDQSEVSELPNCADVTAMDIILNGMRLNLDQIKPTSYIRFLNLKTAELTRKFDILTHATGLFTFESKRFVSLKDLHLVGQKIVIKAISKDLTLELTSGIDGQQTNSGVQHFTEGAKRLYDKRCLQLVQTTTQSKIDFVINMIHNIFINGSPLPVSGRVSMDRRQIFMTYRIDIKEGEELVIEKFSTLHTSRDREWLQRDFSLKTLCDTTWTELLGKAERGYDLQAAESAELWEKKVWQSVPIEIESKNPIDQLALRFAQYHLTAMTPSHDNRMNIGAKGLSGEGYKGHTFWDTEIFMLPYFTWNQPHIARSLLEHRYLTLPGARKKAKDNGYEGAMFPWESAWLDEGETTPVWGAADIITGEATKIWSGFIEQHITSDIVFGVWQYFCITHDQDYMDTYGYELILDAAKFWVTRLEWDEARKKYCINGVIGPDEYKEHVNNNAFTNYTAHWTIGMAIRFYEELQKEKPMLFEQLHKKLDLARFYGLWKERLDVIFLPQPTEEGVIPQDDTYLGKTNIDLTPYKNQTSVGSLFHDYNLEQVNQIQVTKQADVLLLFYLLEDLFSQNIKRASWEYYEPRTLHDSSLSLATHSILASDLGYKKLAYELFKKASDIDLGPDMRSSDPGIHAASLGGLWQSVVNGFGGVRMLHGELRIDPHLPDEWIKLRFTIMWRGDRLAIEMDHRQIQIINETGHQSEINIEIRNQRRILKKQLNILI